MKTVCETGVVVAFDQRRARVRLLPEAACRKCGLAELGLCRSGGAGFEIEARSPYPLAVGDKVRVSRGGKSFADGAGVMTLLPVTGLILGGIAGHLAGLRFGWSPDLAAGVLGLAGLGVAVAVSLLISRRRETRGDFVPTAVKIPPTVCP